MTSRRADLDDAELVARAQRGSASAFEALYDRHVAGVARTLASFAGPDRDLLDDLVQDVFLKVVAGLPSYVPHHPFAQWLFTVALNVGRNHARRQGRIVALDPATVEAVAGGATLDPDWTTLVRHVARLPVTLRDVVSLRVGSDLTYAQIAGVLGIPEGTARRRMHTALQQLRNSLHVQDEAKEQ